MTRNRPLPRCAATLPADLAWLTERLIEARAVIADVAHHSDHLVRLSCDVLVRHGETDERRDARALLFVIEARCPARHRRAQCSDADDIPEERP